MRQPSTWLLIASFSVITFFQYAEELNLPSSFANLNENIGLTRYSLERILYLLPIIWAGILFGGRVGAATAVLAMICMLPRGIFISSSPEDAIVESIAVFLIGGLAVFLLESLRKERKRRAELEAAQKELKSQLQIIEEDERRLAALNQTANIISQSLKLSEVLESAVTCVMEVMAVEAVRIYVLDEEAGELQLAAYRGVSEEFAKAICRLKMGEGFNGQVALTGETLVVKDASEDPRLTKAIVREENIRSQVIVPMMAKGKVVGTLAVAMHRHRIFLPEEINLLTAIANQIGVATDNARLYQQEQIAADQLRTSEERYRGLFENAHDAIWLHDLGDNIIAANTACVELTGYTLPELCHLKAAQLLSEDTLATARDIEEHLLQRHSVGSRGEVKLIKKDGTEAFIELAGSLVYSNGSPVAIQHIARDVTQEKRMRENLRSLVVQTTQAQEEERKRIAQELHDDTVQALVLLGRQIDGLAYETKQLPKKDIPERLKELHEETNVIMQGVQRMSQDLRPAALDRLGLLPAVEWLASREAEYSGMKIDVRFLGDERRLPDEVELVLFRITQEALRNVWKHAKATHVEVTIEFTQTKIRITVSDNGEGFDPPDSVSDLPKYGRLGLAGMQERAHLFGGTLTVTSRRGEGTIVVAELPV